ncbi:leucine-rich repeat transmembrane neuronal protein 1-like [Culicoides brevitarsis]|uniref:leucine-rich repeat transmembrane neuronal protein 1-like n=1 Tax=Culicoides brevitarsis TaxID=469753 RepID=UPI00307BB906
MCKYVLVTTVIFLICSIIVGGYFLWISVFGKRECHRDSDPPIYKCSTTVHIFGWKECSFKNICLDARHTNFVPESDFVPENNTSLDLGGGSGSKMHTLTSDICNKFPVVTIYRASMLGLTMIHGNAFKNCKNLEKLNLGYNSLTHLPRNVFESNTEMKYLYLYFNRLREIDPGIFKTLQKLEKLHLEGNSLISLNLRQFPLMPYLRSLFLHQNQLRVLEVKRIAKKFPRLGYLSLCDNAFIIGTDLHTLLEYFNERHVDTDLRYCLSEKVESDIFK